jgi:hypothetical protein
VFAVGNEDVTDLEKHMISLSPFGKIIKDYFTGLRQLLRSHPLRSAVQDPGHRYRPPRLCTMKAAAS